jgi:hypothetical protein
MGEKGFWDGFWEEVGSDLAAVHLGVAIQSLEETVVTGQFDLSNHIKLFNESMVGIWELQRRKVPESKVVSITDEKLHEMRVAVKEDPTFASLFGMQRRNLLPRQLRAFLHMTTIMPEIQKILPDYREYAEGVLTGYRQTEQDVAEHKAVLDYFDDLLIKLSEPQR